jgi:flagellar motility protein MotE (MotC chaperone)
MKRVLLIGLPLVLVIGGGVGAMFYFGIPPFKKAVKPKTAAAGKQAANHQAAAASAQPSAAVASAQQPQTSVASKTQKSAPKNADSPNLDADEQADARISKLSSVYEQMPADEAGKILAKLPDPFVEKLLRKMDERQVGKLLLTLDTSRAAKLTQSLAQ